MPPLWETESKEKDEGEKEVWQCTFFQAAKKGIRACKEVGGQFRRLLELDWQHGHQGGDLSPTGTAYGALLRLALDGQIKSLLGGPPCRTRSVLRHFEVEGMRNMPRPLRAWDGEELESWI